MRFLDEGFWTRELEKWIESVDQMGQSGWVKNTMG